MRIKFLYLAIAFLTLTPLKLEAKDIVCVPPKFSSRLNNLSYSAYGKLDKKDWQTLVMENKKTKTGSFDNAKRGLTLPETQRILGFYGEKVKSACNRRAEYWVWIDRDNKKAVHIIFLENRINILKGKGF